MALPTLKPVSRKYAWAHMLDVSNPSSAFTVAPCKGQIMKAFSVISVALTGTNSNFTMKINGTLIPGMAWVVTQAGSAAGDVDSATPTARATSRVNEGDTIEFITDGASSTTSPTTCCVEIEMD